MAIPFTKYTFTDSVANDVTAARLNAMGDAIEDAQQMPAVRVTHNANQTLTTAVATTLAFNTERFDTFSGAADTMHDNVTNNSRLTCRYAGIYQITANVEWSAASTNTLLEIRFNATDTVGKDQCVGDQRAQQVTTVWQMAVNDFVEIRATQASGSNKDVVAGAKYSPEFMMVRIA